MKNIGTFQSARWGTVSVYRATYGTADGPVAILLLDKEGELLTKLSINLHKPECSCDSRDLPADCFYVKEWSENAEIAEEVHLSGLFIERPDLGWGHSGFVVAPVWQVKPA